MLIKSHLMFMWKNPVSWMIKSVEVILIALGIVIGMYDILPGQEFEVKSEIEVKDFTVGDPFRLTTHITNIENYMFEVIPPGEMLGSAHLFSDIHKIEDPSKEFTSFVCTLTVYQPGEIFIPTPEFIAISPENDSTFFSGDSISVNILSVLPPDTTQLALSDIKEPVRLRNPVWPFFLIPVGILLIGYLIYYLRRRFSGDLDMPGPPPVPPWDIAIERLDTLKESRHDEFGRFKQFYFELSLILRLYIEARYDFPAAESTTYELKEEKELDVLESATYNRLFDLLGRSDLTKFAKFKPSADDSRQDLDFAYQFVSMTTPKILQENESEPEPEKVIE